jgi:anti-sigma28 factor (negative regulator of flagellin synthesis)
MLKLQEVSRLRGTGANTMAKAMMEEAGANGKETSHKNQVKKAKAVAEGLFSRVENARVVIKAGTYVVDCRWFERMPNLAMAGYEVYRSHSTAKVPLNTCLIVDDLEWLPRQTSNTRTQVRHLAREWVKTLDTHWAAAYAG